MNVKCCRKTTRNESFNSFQVIVPFISPQTTYRVISKNKFTEYVVVMYRFTGTLDISNECLDIAVLESLNLAMFKVVIIHGVTLNLEDIYYVSISFCSNFFHFQPEILLFFLNRGKNLAVFRNAHNGWTSLKQIWIHHLVQCVGSNKRGGNIIDLHFSGVLYLTNIIKCCESCILQGPV